MQINGSGAYPNWIANGAARSITKDFNGLPIVFREDGYINMTKAAKQFPGKRLQNFWDNSTTEEYVVALHRALAGNSWNSSVWDANDYLAAYTYLVQAKRGGKKGTAGTWCHPKLAVFFARWLDVRFAVWCDLMIDNILRGNIQATVVVPTVEAVDVVAVVEPIQNRNQYRCAINYLILFVFITVHRTNN